MTTTTVAIRSNSRPVLMIIAALAACAVAVIAGVSLAAVTGDGPAAAPTGDVRQGSADAVERWLTPAAGAPQATADALERRLAVAATAGRSHATPDALERRLAPPEVHGAEGPRFGSADALERSASR